MDRRAFLKYSLVSGAGVLSMNNSIYSQTSQAEAPKKPNFIFILADDLGWGDLACYGHPYLKTPNIDRLAARGIKFQQFYVSPLCSPTRVGFMTGRFPADFGINVPYQKKEVLDKIGQPYYLDPKVTTIMRLFQSDGYRTGHYGKWHLGPWPRMCKGVDIPLPKEYGIDESRCPMHNWPEFNFKKDRAISSQLYIDEGIKFVDRNKNKPFFLNIWLNDVHFRLKPTPEQLKEHYPDIPPTDPFAINWSVIAEMDKQVGRLLKHLQELGLDKNTIVIFASDNGPVNSDSLHKKEFIGVGNAGPFRGRKGSLLEGGVRTPFIISCPGLIPQGKTNKDTILAITDMLPSLCDIARIKLPQDLNIDGENMSAALLGKNITRKKPLMFKNLSPGKGLHGSPALAIRKGNWKLYMNPDRSDIQLYDIPNDLSETDNKAQVYPEIAKQLADQLYNWNENLPKKFEKQSTF